MPKPYFRYETSSLELGTGVRAPVFPVQMGTNFHTYSTDKPAYVVSERDYGTSVTSWQTQDVKKPDRDIINTFWSTTLTDGYYPITVIDHRNRMLFEASWNNWKQDWKKNRGGVYDIRYDIDSPLPWTLPCFGAYPMAQNNLNSHNMSGDNLSLVDGVLITDDSNTLRENGYILRLSGDGTTSALTGASGTVSWKPSSGSLALFCQFRIPELISPFPLDILSIRSGDVGYSIYAEQQTPDTDDIGIRLYDSLISGSCKYSQSIYTNKWYDVCATYDSQSGENSFYIMPTDEQAHVPFATTSTDITDFIANTTTGSKTAPDNIEYTNCVILDETHENSGIYSGENAYVQNAFVFDGFLDPMGFDFMRRLCLMWNTSTESMPK